MSRKRQTGVPPDTSEDEKVGYGRPPQRHRVRPGETRNPWGRGGKPKPRIDFLDEAVKLQIDGEPRTVTRAEALDYFLFAKAAKGDVRAVHLLQLRARERLHTASSPTNGTLSSEEQAAFERFLRRAASKLPKEDRA